MYPPTTPLISIIKRKHDSYVNERIKKYDLSAGTYPILIAIYQNESIIQEEVADLFKLNESTVTRAINKLEEKGFVKKSPNIKNKRKNYIEITGKGKKVAVEVMDLEYEWDEYCFESLSQEEYMNFKNSLMKVCDKLIDRS